MGTAGVVGVGAMGTVIVERHRRAGLQVLAYDVSNAALERAAALGAEPCPSPAAVGRAAEDVGVLVRTDEQMLNAVLGPGGVLEGLTSGKVLLLHSTIHPSVTRQIATAAQAKGVDVLDACISARPDEFRAGKAACIVGGDPAVVERVRPHLEQLGQIYYMGPLGSGNVAKIVHNLVVVSQRMILHEALQIAEAAGIPYQHELELLRRMPPLLASPDETLNPRTWVPTGHGGNLFEAILPPADRLADELGLDLPITRLLASEGNPYAP
jgi:3-hydroxyisobutyrate dehydrogenase-like beta-hydroxyacid dehydrogenase